MRPRHASQYTSHALRGPIGSSTEGPSSRAYMRLRHPSRHPPRSSIVFRGPVGGSTGGPSGGPHTRFRHPCRRAPR
eukprot:6489567-Pyramimonas_sp.AAC.1